MYGGWWWSNAERVSSSVEKRLKLEKLNIGGKK